MQLLKQLSIYSFSSFLSRSVPFFMLPIMTSYLSPEEYGIVAIVMVLVTLVSCPLFMGIHSYINIEFFKLKDKEHLELVNTLIFIPVILVLPITAIFYAYLVFGGWSWSIPYIWFVAIPLLALMTFSYRIITVIFRVKEQVSYYGFLEILYSVCQVSFALLFVVSWSKGLEGRLFAIFFSSFIINIVAIQILYKQGYLTSGFKKGYIKEAIKYGLGIIPHEFGGQLTRMVDRLFIITMLGASATGNYAVAAQIASIGLVVLSVFNLAWQPYVFKCLSNNNLKIKHHLVKLSWIVIILFGIFFLALNFCVPYIYDYFIAEAYHSSVEYVKWLLLGYFFLSVYMLFCDYIFYVKKTYLLSLITLFNLLLLLILNYIFILKYGAIGATYAFSVSSGLICFLTIIVSTNIYPMPWFRVSYD